MLEFCEKKGKDIPELSDTERKSDLAFAINVTVLYICTSDVHPDFNTLFSSSTNSISLTEQEKRTETADEVIQVWTE